MAKRLNANWITSYLKYTRFSESPTVFHFWTAVSVLGAALRRRVWIEERSFQWTPNFYIILVAPAGVVSKTTSINIGFDLLRRLDDGRIKFGPQAITYPALTEALADCFEYATGLGNNPEENFPMSCITCNVGELGTFLNPQDNEMVNALTSLWDGQLGVWEKKTKTSGSDRIVNPWVNIIACTTPSWIAANYSEDMIGGGLSSRILFVYGDKKRKLVAYPSQEIDYAAFEEEALMLAHDLDTISCLGGEYRMTANAIKWGTEWYEKHWDEGLSTLREERFGGYRARKQTHIHKLAIVLAAAESDEMVIDVHHLQKAKTAIEAIEPDMRIVHSKIGESETHRNLQGILTFLDAYGPLTEDRLWRNCLASMSGEEFKRAIAGGIRAGILRRVVRGSTTYIEKGTPK